jgi:TetR/AcrR family transcriptional regulator, cholesterol catabolism regulator
VEGDKKSDLKQRIVSEGLRLFLRKGFRNTTINDIINAMGVSKGAFYWHFQSKNELLETIIKEFEETFLDRAIDAVTKTRGTFLRKFKYYHKYITEFALNHKELCMGFMTVSAELAGNETDLERKISRVYEKHRGFLKGLVATGRKEQVLKKDLDIDMAAHVIMAINHGMLLEWYMNQGTMNSQLLAKSYREIILSGMLDESKKSNS